MKTAAHKPVCLTETCIRVFMHEEASLVVSKISVFLSCEILTQIQALFFFVVLSFSISFFSLLFHPQP